MSSCKCNSVVAALTSLRSDGDDPFLTAFSACASGCDDFGSLLVPSSSSSSGSSTAISALGGLVVLMDLAD